MNNDYKIVNIAWIDRCIKLAIIKNIITYYKKLVNKKIIIDNKEYRYFSRKMFPELIFKKFNKFKINNKDNFYINIKHILIKKHIIIDYINNYTKYIPTTNIYYIPWYDINDPIITFKYSKHHKLNYVNEFNKIINFSKFLRYNNNILWDYIIEYNILNDYKKNKSISNINIVYFNFNKLLKYNYFNNYNKIIYIPLECSNNNNTNYINNIINNYKNKIHILETDLDKLIDLINQKLSDLLT